MACPKAREEEATQNGGNIDRKYAFSLVGTGPNKGGIDMAILANKKVIAIGDRDGVPGPAIEEVIKTAGGEIVFSSTECFV